MNKTFAAYAELCKLRIALLSSLSSAVGFLLSAPEISTQIILLFLGVFVLACGSSALNHYQERDTDALMPRTIKRPLPSGRIRPAQALNFSLVLLVSGCAALLLTGVAMAALLGLFAVLWYNGVYTSIKRVTAFAVVPGALTGALPPAIGWIAGGGTAMSPKQIVLCLFFFIWQVPHSWLLMMRYGREYEQAGLPALTHIFSELQMKRIIFSWLFATAASCLFLSAIGFVHYLAVFLALILLCSWLLWQGVRSLVHQDEKDFSLPVFIKTNYYLLLVMLLLSTDRVLSINRISLPF